MVLKVDRGSAPDPRAASNPLRFVIFGRPEVAIENALQGIVVILQELPGDASIHYEIEGVIRSGIDVKLCGNARLYKPPRILDILVDEQVERAG